MTVKRFPNWAVFAVAVLRQGGDMVLTDLLYGLVKAKAKTFRLFTEALITVTFFK